MKSLRLYLKELEALVVDHPRRQEYETLRQEYSNSVRYKTEGRILLVMLTLMLRMLPSPDIAPLFVVPATSVLGARLEKAHAKTKDQMEEVRGQIASRSQGAIQQVPLQVAIDILVGKKPTML